MRYLVISLAVLTGCASHKPSEPVESHPTTAQAAADVEPLSQLNHPVATTNAEAQRHFNDGLTLVYAFNHDEAVRSFKKALDADPNLAMAHWGIALAVGPNYNMPVDAAREKQGYEEIQKAIELSNKSSKSPAQEKAYIAALAKRFSNAEKPDLNKLAVDYAEAMGALARQYPDDADAATLYADAMMNLRP